MTGPVLPAHFDRTLLAGALALALFAGATPALALSQLQPASTAEELKKPPKPGEPGGGDDGDNGGGQPAPPAGGGDPKPPAGGGADDGDNGGGQPAPPAGGGSPKPPAGGGADDGDNGGGQPAPPAGGGDPKPPAGGGADDGDEGGGGAQPAPPPADGQPTPPPESGGEDGGDEGDQPADPNKPAPPAPPANDDGGDDAADPDDPARPPTDAAGPPPEIQYDLTALPQPVQRMRELIVEACKTGDPEKLRPLIGTGESQTRLSLDEAEADPVEILKQSSGDGEGQEIMAILLEVLEAGYVHLDAGKDTELYVWPYFFAIPLDKLSIPQRVELFKLITSGDYEDMKGYGAYIFYRVGITPDGKWEFFLAGD